MASEEPSTEHVEYAPGQETKPVSVPVTLDSAPKIDNTENSEGTAPINIDENKPKEDISGPKVTVKSIPSPVPEKRTSTRTHTTTILQTLEDKWIFETFCCIWALFNLVAMIITLAVRQERSIPSWPSSISLNSLISIFTALLKAAMMVVVAASISQLKWHWFNEPHVLADIEDFDGATRGPWGACILLLSTRKHYLASFGALITILALAIDPFSQQIIQYYTCTEPLAGSIASLPRTNNYTDGGMLGKPGFAELDNTMAAALYMGTIDPPVNPSSNIAFDCSTGNCTFPAIEDATFSTLGICYSVIDLAEHIKPNITHNVTVGYWLPDLSWGMPADNSSYAEADVGMDNLATSGPAQSLVTVANSHWKMLAPKKVLENGPGFTPDFDALFTFDALMLKVNSSCNVMDSDIHLTERCEKHPWAFRASLYPCIKTYRSTIVKSMPEEVLISTLPLWKTNASAIEVTTTANLTYSLATDSILVNGSWEKCEVSNHFSPSTPVPISVNKTLQLFPEEPTMWYPAECVWMLDYVPALALNQFLSWMYDESPLLAVTSNTVITSGSIWLKPLYRNGTADIDSVTKYIEGLADAMTVIIRQRGSGRVLGIVEMSQTCIRVNWVWMSLPAGLVGLTILLFACTVESCRRSDLWDATRSWRCSSLALLFHGCDDQMRQKMSDTVSNREMTDVSKSVTVEMRRTPQGLRFVERASA